MNHTKGSRYRLNCSRDRHRHKGNTKGLPLNPSSVKMECVGLQKVLCSRATELVSVTGCVWHCCVKCLTLLRRLLIPRDEGRGPTESRRTWLERESVCGTLCKVKSCLLTLKTAKGPHKKVFGWIFLGESVSYQLDKWMNGLDVCAPRQRFSDEGWLRQWAAACQQSYHKSKSHKICIKIVYLHTPDVVGVCAIA